MKPHGFSAKSVYLASKWYQSEPDNQTMLMISPPNDGGDDKVVDTSEDIANVTNTVFDGAEYISMSDCVL